MELFGMPRLHGHIFWWHLCWVNVFLSFSMLSTVIRAGPACERFFCRERYCTSFLWTIPTRSTVSSQVNDFISSLVSRRTAWHRLVCSHKRLIQSHASTQSYCSSYLPLWLLWGRENISYSFLDILVAYPESTMYTTFLCFSLHFYCQPSI